MKNQKATKEKLYIYENGEVYLQLNNEIRFRHLGIVQDNIFTSYKRKKDVFRKTNSFAFNYNLLQTSAFKILHIVFENSTHFFISREIACTIGKKMTFEELQLFIPIESFHKTLEEALKELEPNTSGGNSFGNSNITTPPKFSGSDSTQLFLFK